MARQINIDDKLDRWRYTCLRGHCSWEATNHHFWCQACANRYDVAQAFDELVDRQSRERLPRDTVELVTDAGPYRALRANH